MDGMILLVAPLLWLLFLPVLAFFYFPVVHQKWLLFISLLASSTILFAYDCRAFFLVHTYWAFCLAKLRMFTMIDDGLDAPAFGV